MITGTLLIAGVAIVFAVPLAAGVALYISEYAPRRLRRTMINIIDLMAAVPGVVYGLWGAALLNPGSIPLTRWISSTFGWVPFLGISGVDPNSPAQTPVVYESSTFIAGIAVALMVMPTTCAVMRESFFQAPAGEREAAYALGATRWGMIYTVVLPFGEGGIIGGTMLGLGRAMGETIVVYLIITPVYHIQPQIALKFEAASDEISYRKGHRYLLCVVDHDTGRLVWAAKGRDSQTLRCFFDALGADRSALLTHISADGAEWIHTVATERAPQAVLCLDAFHVVALATTAVDAVRRGTCNQLRQDGKADQAKALKNSRWALLKTHPTSPATNAPP